MKVGIIFGFWLSCWQRGQHWFPWQFWHNSFVHEVQIIILTSGLGKTSHFLQINLFLNATVTFRSIILSKFSIFQPMAALQFLKNYKLSSLSLNFDFYFFKDFLFVSYSQSAVACQQRGSKSVLPVVFCQKSPNWTPFWPKIAEKTPVFCSKSENFDPTFNFYFTKIANFWGWKSRKFGDWQRINFVTHQNFKKPKKQEIPAASWDPW